MAVVENSSVKAVDYALSLCRACLDICASETKIVAAIIGPYLQQPKLQIAATESIIGARDLRSHVINFFLDNRIQKHGQDDEGQTTVRRAALDVDFVRRLQIAIPDPVESLSDSAKMIFSVLGEREETMLGFRLGVRTLLLDNFAAYGRTKMESVCDMIVEGISDFSRIPGYMDLGGIELTIFLRNIVDEFFRKGSRFLEPSVRNRIRKLLADPRPAIPATMCYFVKQGGSKPLSPSPSSDSLRPKSFTPTKGDYNARNPWRKGEVSKEKSYVYNTPPPAPAKGSLPPRPSSAMARTRPAERSATRDFAVEENAVEQAINTLLTGHGKFHSSIYNLRAPQTQDQAMSVERHVSKVMDISPSGFLSSRGVELSKSKSKLIHADSSPSLVYVDNLGDVEDAPLPGYTRRDSAPRFESSRPSSAPLFRDLELDDDVEDILNAAGSSGTSHQQPSVSGPLRNQRVDVATPTLKAGIQFNTSGSYSNLTGSRMSDEDLSPGGTPLSPSKPSGPLPSSNRVSPTYRGRKLRRSNEKLTTVKDMHRSSSKGAIHALDSMMDALGTLSGGVQITMDGNLSHVVSEDKNLPPAAAISVSDPPNVVQIPEPAKVTQPNPQVEEFASHEDEEDVEVNVEETSNSEEVLAEVLRKSLNGLEVEQSKRLLSFEEESNQQTATYQSSLVALRQSFMRGMLGSGEFSDRQSSLMLNLEQRRYELESQRKTYLEEWTKRYMSLASALKGAEERASGYGAKKNPVTDSNVESVMRASTGAVMVRPPSNPAIPSRESASRVKHSAAERKSGVGKRAFGPGPAHIRKDNSAGIQRARPFSFQRSSMKGFTGKIPSFRPRDRPPKAGPGPGNRQSDPGVFASRSRQAKFLPREIPRPRSKFFFADEDVVPDLWKSASQQSKSPEGAAGDSARTAPSAQPEVRDPKPARPARKRWESTNRAEELLKKEYVSRGATVKENNTKNAADSSREREQMLAGLRAAEQRRRREAERRKKEASAGHVDSPGPADSDEKSEFVANILIQKPWIRRREIVTRKLSELQARFELEPADCYIDPHTNDDDRAREVGYIRASVDKIRNRMRESKTDLELRDDVRYYCRYDDFLYNRIMQKNYYGRLDLKEPASVSAVRKAYRKAALIWHPDNARKDNRHYFANETQFKSFMAKVFQIIDDAYRVLSDETKKKVYDAKRRVS